MLFDQRLGMSKRMSLGIAVFFKNMFA
jgi:hypothetical protein